MTLALRVRGPRACFTRPEFKTERVSYPLITPSAARAIFECVLWKPSMAWIIRQVEVLAPVRWVSTLTNELDSKVPPGGALRGMDPEEHRAQRHNLMLRDVDYVIHADVRLTDKAGPGENLRKFEEMFLRRLENGQLYRQPCLGLRELSADITPAHEAPDAVAWDEDLGLVHWGIDWASPDLKALPFRALVKGGILRVPENPLTTLDGPKPTNGSLLTSLYSMAARESLLDMGWEMATVPWLLVLSLNGDVLRLESTRDAEGKPRSFRIPAIPIRSSNISAGTFVDKSQYVLGLDPEGKASPKRLTLMREAFANRMQEVYDATKDDGARAALRFSAKDQQMKLPEDFVPGDRIALALESGLITDRPAVRTYYDKTRASDVNPDVLCWISGETGPAVGLHPKVECPGTNPGGAPLVSFNASSTWSWGREGNDNFPCSAIAAEGAGIAANVLLKDKRRSYRVAEAATLIYWTDRPCPFPEALATLLETGEADLGTEDGDVPFHAAVLYGERGRISVRSWVSAPLERIRTSVVQHREDLGRKIPFWSLLQSCEGPKQSYGAALRIGIVNAMLTGEPYPVQLMDLLGTCIRAEFREMLRDRKDGWIETPRHRSQLALLRATLNRLERKEGLALMANTLDPHNHNVGYLLGQSLALADRVQEASLGRAVRGSNSAMYFNTLSVTPQLAYPAMARNIRVHIHKIKHGGGSYVWLAKAWRRNANDLGQEIPPTLTPKDQSLFMLGFNQMESWLWSTKEAKAEWETKHGLNTAKSEVTEDADNE